MSWRSPRVTFSPDIPILGGFVGCPGDDSGELGCPVGGLTPSMFCSMLEVSVIAVSSSRIVAIGSVEDEAPVWVSGSAAFSASVPLMAVLRPLRERLVCIFVFAGRPK
ncbi:MAG: hypothetical protein HOK04_13870 [Verrucomicrobia bacterium]|nr:hypothetical protein [Verrucomicrobiota bacterium]